MSNATIPLAKGDIPKARNVPGSLSVKLDGVPVLLTFVFNEGEIRWYSVMSRQGEAVPSVDLLVREFGTLLQATGLIKDGTYLFLAETTHKTLRNFKDVSGVVRRQSPQKDLVLNMFDYVALTHPESTWLARQVDLTHVMQHIQHPALKMVHQHSVSADRYDYIKERLLELNPNCEGLVWRAHKDVWAPGKRLVGYQKILNEPTVDLRIVGFEEAKCSKTKAGKGMVGRLIAEYKGERIGIGPGKLTHKERKDLFNGITPWGEYEVYRDGDEFKWLDWGDKVTGLAQIKHKADASYTALRQPTFQHWRLDKTEVSYE